MTDPTGPAPKTKAENLLLNLVFNLALPTAIQTWGSGPRALGPNLGLAVALLFPLGYGLYDYAVRRRFNFVSAIGFISILITGGFGLLHLSGFWFAVKDGAVPALIGVAVLVSLRTKNPLVQEMLYNPQVIDVDRIDAALTARGTQPEFAGLLAGASRLLALAFFLSAGLNFVLARLIITAQPGTELFVQQLARMHWASLGGAVLPAVGMMMFAMWRLFSGVQRITGLTLDEILKQPAEKTKDATPPDPVPPAGGAA
ncbi:MAG: transporter [Lacunisphaera sp.]|nr:transporter [Lacunisphaera sp.]MDB6166976.1 transporter [Lacunisphaera sp.]